MSGFTKLFSSITESSIWCEDDKVLRVWVAMLARVNSEGIVEGSIPGFANLCRMPVEDLVRCLERLKAPDPYSRTPDNEGRRIEEITGGWLILNYAAYRDRGQGKEGSRAPYMRKYRSAKENEQNVTRNKRVLQDVTRNKEESRVTQKQIADADADKTPCSPPLGDGLQELRLRIGGWLRRRPTTEWSDRENRKLKEVARGLEEADLLLLERYYTSKCKYLRQDVMTLLNNWNGELDRARNWIGTVAGSQTMLIPVAKSEPEPPKNALEAVKTDYRYREKLTKEDAELVFDDIRSQFPAENPEIHDEQELQ